MCLSLVFALDKLALSDLPQTDRGPEYAAYCDALRSGLDCEDTTQREFFFISSTHFGYIEELLNRLGLVAIRQIITGLFINTLAKGVGLVWCAVLGLIVAVFWFGDSSKPFLAMVTTFTAVGSALLLTEVWVDLRRAYGDELDFVERGSDDEA